ncbi:Transcription factor bHLH96 [Dichanthelium oligosanthes]|uniref:Transcription factor bHLH96 n=1 Tax=Dichanthelium oligosanthes TaxID=888268 RepID=A0A1E5UJR1_9POAL|nr:Transcription factor bHLH96 [Dichanthelium oligosanthes]
MALEAVVFSEGLFGSWAMAAAPGGVGGGWSWGHGENGRGEAMEGMMDLEEAAAAAGYWDVGASSSVMMQGAEEPDGSSAAPPPENGGGGGNAAAAGAGFGQEVAVAATAVAMSPPPAGRRKRRRARSVKNREEVESQRMTHIAIERNRRKQMNEYLAVLRSFMPPSYVQRGDQASIIGGAINYVKELEQLLQSLEAWKHARARHDLSPGAGDAAAAPFAGFFTFPQYSMSAATSALSPVTSNTTPAEDEGPNNAADADGNGGDDASGSRPSSVADIEVTMVESHANLKLLSRWRPRQLLRLVAGLQGHRLTVLHLNATSDAHHMALYSLSLKVEDDCALSSVDDIAAAVHRILEAIDQEAASCTDKLRSIADD